MAASVTLIPRLGNSVRRFTTFLLSRHQAKKAPGQMFSHNRLRERLLLICEAVRIRTCIYGFGDRRSTVELPPRFPEGLGYWTPRFRRALRNHADRDVLFVAGMGIEPMTPGYEPGELPLFHPAMCFKKPDTRICKNGARRNQSLKTQNQ